MNHSTNPSDSTSQRGGLVSASHDSPGFQYDLWHRIPLMEVEKIYWSRGYGARNFLLQPQLKYDWKKVFIQMGFFYINSLRWDDILDTRNPKSPLFYIFITSKFFIRLIQLGFQ